MTQRILQKRINEHSSCETRHAQLANHDINFASPSILAHDNVKLRLQIKETFNTLVIRLYSLNHL